MWTKDDLRLLRSMRIDAADPPEALPRFRVEPGDIDGWYRVIDVVRGFRPSFDFGPDWQDPRAAAEDLAGQLNEKHRTQLSE